MGAFDTVFSYITDKERRLSTKTYVSIICIFLILALDNIVGFSYHYSMDRKLNEVKIVGEILKDSTLDQSVKKDLIKTRTELLRKRYFYGYISESFSSIFSNNSVKKTPEEAQVQRSNFWFLISTSGIYLLCYFILIIIFPFMDDKNSFGQKIAIEIVIAIFGFVHISLFYWLMGLIPKLSDTWTWNYILNGSIQIAFTIILSLLVNKETKKKSKKPKAKDVVETIELYNTAPNGLKIDYLILKKVPNLDASDWDYEVEYVDRFSNDKRIFVGTFDLILADIKFAETPGLGIPFGAIKLLSEWIEKHREP